MKYGRAILEGVEGYVPGEQPKIPGLIKLNTNENPYPPSPKVMEALAALPERALRQYPDSLAVELRKACAARYGLPDESWVFAGNGMDEVLAMAVRSFTDPGDLIVSTNPTYTLYETLAQLHGARYEACPFEPDFGLPAGLAASGARLAFVPRPNAPIGVVADRDALAAFCETFNGIVFIDEAYVDFASDHCLDFVQRFDNVLIGRTFSKSFSLAGMRIGLGIANPDLLAAFWKTKDSYNVNAATQAAGLAAINDYEHMLGNVARVQVTRERLIEQLRGLGFDVPESQANFVLARWSGTPDARAIHQALRERALLVRYFDLPGLKDALRISVGTDEEIDALLSGLRAILAEA